LPHPEHRAPRPDARDALLDAIGCRAACPVHTNAGQYARAVGRGDLREAVRIARARNPMVRTTAWVCTHPCEAGCIREAIDAPLSLRDLKRYAVERVDPAEVAPQPHDARGRGHRIAIVGAGPAGLAAAHDLALLRYRVTVFEAAETAGGMPATLIPPFRLPAAVVAADVADIERLGVEIRTGTWVEGPPTELLGAGYDRVLVATGAPRGRPLDVPGARLPGVYDGLQLLRALARGDPTGLGERIVVVGGGDTAVDVARAVGRAASGDVSLVFRRPRLDGRARRQEAERAAAEGVRLVPGAIPVAVQGSERVEGLVVSTVRTYHDAEARYRPSARAGTRVLLEADSVVVAVGRTGAVDAPPLDGAAVSTGRGTHLRIGDGWAGGGDLGGAGTVVAAMADGQELARWVDRELTGGEPRTSVRLSRTGRTPHPSPEPIGRRKPDSPPTASIEGGRCLNCWIGVRVAPDGGCIECGRCAEACPGGALATPPVGDSPREPGVAGRRCLRCGLCVERCPTSCLELVEVCEEACRDG